MVVWGISRVPVAGELGLTGPVGAEQKADDERGRDVRAQPSPDGSRPRPVRRSRNAHSGAVQDWTRLHARDYTVADLAAHVPARQSEP